MDNHEVLLLSLIRLIHRVDSAEVVPYYSAHTAQHPMWEVEAKKDGTMLKITTGHKSKSDAMVAALSPDATCDDG